MLVGWWLCARAVSRKTPVYLKRKKNDLSQSRSGKEGEDQTAELGEEAEPDEAGQDGFGV